MFDGLTALTSLDELTALSVQQLSRGSAEQLSVHASRRGVRRADRAEELYLYNNSLSTLPAGVFEDLTELTQLWLQDNPGAPFAPTADALPDDGEVRSPGAM